MKRLKILGWGFLASLCCLNSVYAALPAEIYSSWVDSYLKRVNVEVEASFVEVEGRWTNKIRNLLHADGTCRTAYEIRSVARKPEEMDLKEGDRIEMEYPCRADHAWSWGGSTYPWINLENGGSIQMSLRSMYLDYRGKRVWELDNQANLFAPLIPPETAA